MHKKTITSIAIGGFDGMHLAHQELFKKLDSNGAIIVIQTDYANLTPYRQRDKYTSLPVFYYPLENIKLLDGEQFISLLKEEFPKLKKIIVGYDFRFGHKASSNTEDLNKLFDGEVEVIKEFKLDDISIHSRVIREYISNGNIELANKFLGHPYKIEGFTVKGQGLGSKEFVPTINIDIKDFLIPKEGIYITNTLINEKRYKSISFIGNRKTTDNNFAIETHILNDTFKKCETKELSIEFIKFSRENKKFDSFKELKEQIDKDIKLAKDYFTSLQK